MAKPPLPLRQDLTNSPQPGFRSAVLSGVQYHNQSARSLSEDHNARRSGWEVPAATQRAIGAQVPIIGAPSRRDAGLQQSPFNLTVCQNTAITLNGDQRNRARPNGRLGFTRPSAKHVGHYLELSLHLFALLLASCPLEPPDSEREPRRVV